MPEMITSPAPDSHTLFEDAQAIFTGTLFVSLALILFGQVGLLTCLLYTSPSPRD